MPDLKNLYTLVVDDNATNRQILGAYLARWGVKCTAVASGAEALAELRRSNAQGRPYGLVLLDAMMPEMDGFTLAGKIKALPNLPATLILMLSSACQLDHVERCRQAGINLFLTKPIKQSDLFDAIMSTCGATAKARRSPRAGAAAADSRSQRPLRILLAEDHPINQRLAVRLLEKWGHTVVVANHGREAVEALRREAFEVVLMDVQMPEMCGLKATRTIREREREQGEGGHVPIVAMTAHAIKGDREQCLEAGMDDYVTKPIDPEKLFAVLEGIGLSLAPPAESSRQSQDPAGATAGSAVPLSRYNLRGIMDKVDGDLELMRELVLLYFEDTAGLPEKLRAAIQAGDCEILERAAHRLKGGVSNFGAIDLVDLALRLERMAHDQALEGAEDVLLNLEKEMIQLHSVLESVVNQKAA